MRVKKTVFLVDIDVAQCNAISEFLESSGFRVRTFPSAEAFLESAESVAEGIILLDQCLTGMSALELLNNLARRNAGTPIVLIIEHSDVRSAIKAIKAGAINVLEKPINNEELLACVKEAFLNVADNNESNPWIARVRQCYASLSDREKEVMRHIIDGMTSKRIAALLGISHRTVELHRAHITNKMESESLADMVRKHDICQNTGTYRLRREDAWLKP